MEWWMHGIDAAIPFPATKADITNQSENSFSLSSEAAALFFTTHSGNALCLLELI